MSMILSMVVIFTAYLFGCIAVGYYLVRWRTGQDLRELGSGATGGRNTGRVLGRSGAILTALGDLLKGVLAVTFALWLKADPWAAAACIAAATAGHVWPLQLGFKGGKGLATAFGAVLVYDYRIALIAILFAAVLALLSRRVTLSFMLGVVTAPFSAFFFHAGWAAVAALTVTAVIIVYAHRENIQEALKS